MAFSYSPAMESKLDQVRFHIGDTVQEDPQLQDEEIEYLLTLTDGSVVQAAIAAIDTLIAKYSRYVDKWVGDLKILASQRYEQYVALRGTLVEGIGVSPGASGVPTAGGVYVADKVAARANTALVQPTFYRGIHDNWRRWGCGDYHVRGDLHGE